MFMIKRKASTSGKQCPDYVQVQSEIENSIIITMAKEKLSYLL